MEAKVSVFLDDRTLQPEKPKKTSKRDSFK